MYPTGGLGHGEVKHFFVLVHSVSSESFMVTVVP